MPRYKTAGEAIDVLNANRLIRSRDEFEEFETSLAELAAAPDPQYLPQLHLVLDDGCRKPEVMFGLVHFLEDFDMGLQLRALITSGASLRCGHRLKNVEGPTTTLQERADDHARFYHRTVLPR